MARFLISWQARRTLTHKRRHTKTLLTPHILYVACMCSSWERAGRPLRRTKGCFVRWRCSANQRSLPCSIKSSWKLHFSVSSSFQSFFPFWNDACMCIFEHGILVARRQRRVTGNIPCQRMMENGEWSCPKDHSDGIRHPPCSLSLSVFLPLSRLTCYFTHGGGWFRWSHYKHLNRMICLWLLRSSNFKM